MQSEAELAFNSFGGKPITLDKFTKWYCSEFERRVQEEALKLQRQLDESQVPTTTSQTVIASSSSSSKKQKLDDAYAQSQKLQTQRDLVIRRIISSFELSLPKTKFYESGSRETISFDAVMSENEFNMLFKDIGTIDSAAKPTKSKINKILSNEEVQELFGAYLKKIKTSTFSVPVAFRKQIKTGKAHIQVTQIHISFSKNTMNAKMKFDTESECLYVD